MTNAKKKTRAGRQAVAGSKQISFLPMPEFNPIWPRKNSLAYHALLLMLQGKKVSHPDFENHTGSWRLAAYILVLKKLGWPIEDDFIEHSNLSGLKECKISLYFLDNFMIKKFKMQGVLYDK